MPKPPAAHWRETLSRWKDAQSGDEMSKPPQDIFSLSSDVVKPLVPRIEIALTVPDGVDIQITVNGVGVLMQDEDDVDPDAEQP
jgi:hypothetical protein